MIGRLLLIFILYLSSVLQIVNAAYEPFEIEAIKVTNTLAADVNTGAITQFNNFNTTAVINSDTDIFTSVDSDGVNCAPGIYMVDVILYREDFNGGNGPRTNVAIEVTVDGVGTGTIGHGYIRSSNDGSPGGDNEGSCTVSDLVTLSAPGKIGFTTLRTAGTRVSPAPAGESLIRIVRIDD